MTDNDKEIIRDHKEKIINFLEPADYYKILEDNYLIGFNRIKWSAVLGHLQINLSDNSEKLYYIEEFIELVLQKYPEIYYDTVVVWGDEAIDLAYEMQFSEFQKICMLFFELPQHTYVWIKNAQKLLNYTMEDELFFG